MLDSHQTQTSGSGRKHARLVSQPRMVRRSTRGPLDDADDPLSDPAPSSLSVVSSAVNLPSVSPNAAAGEHERPRSTSLSEPVLDHVAFDLRFLQDPRIYHRIDTEDVPSVFLQSHHQPVPTTPIDELLSHGHYRRAAIAALGEMTSGAVPTKKLLRLYYIRLACLVLISRPDLAVQEAVPLSDFLAGKTPDSRRLTPILPWELRLLLVRLQSIGGVENRRRGIQSLYGLASELRQEIKEAQTTQDTKTVATLRSHLDDLGLRVADALVEMGELETASRHLETLPSVDNNELYYRKTLIRLRLGDTQGAESLVEKITEESLRLTLTALLKSCDPDRQATIQAWTKLLEQDPDNELFANNLAISLLYAGHIDETRKILDDLASRSPAFPALLFNPSTVYELCTADITASKMALLSRMADKAPLSASGGWERSRVEVKI